jgi:hypothetical protein
MKNLVAAMAVGLVALGSGTSARADVTPPEESACSSLQSGAACTISPGGASGTCQSTTCSHLDYAHRDDGGIPTTAQTACLKCLDTGGNVPTTTTTTPEKSSGCSQALSTSSTREVAALLFAGAFSLLFFLKRRRPST